ncbi:MAG TPA: CopD family protein [Gammaproteobacteria bacterium]|nr:CopD family protein [Gammaproteobacteria bacterium]
MRWVLAFHIIFMVTWFAGLFYLPRLFVYHEAAREAALRERFAVMERRLFVIMTIGMAATVGFGIWLVAGWFWPLPLWLEVKLALVAALLVYHFQCLRMMLRLARGARVPSQRALRYFNEVPALFLIAIVILAVVRPA